jgi:predicted Na+-dependent transporter
MTLNDFDSAIARISALLFMVTSMLAMNLSLSVQQITQTLKNVRLVIMALRSSLATTSDDRQAHSLKLLTALTEK